MNRLLLPAPATKQEPLTEETAPELDTNLWRGARGRGGTARHSTWSTSRGGSGKEILNARSSGTLP